MCIRDRFTVTAYQYDLSIGSFQLYGAPEFCRSRTGKKHNIVNLTGALAGQEWRIDTTKTDVICDALMPQEKSWEAKLNDAVMHGFVYGASDVLEDSLSRVGVSSWVSSTVKNVTYLGAMFTIRYYQHHEELLETETPEIASYQAMVAAGAETATLAAIQLAYKASDVLGHQLKQRGGLWQYPSYLLEGTKEAVSMARYSRSNPVNVVAGFASQTAVQLVGNSLVNTLFGRRQPALAIMNNGVEDKSKIVRINNG